MDNKTHQAIELIRALIRPVITLSFVWGYLLMKGLVPPLYGWLLTGVVVWWFGDRTFFKVNQFRNGGKNGQ